MKANEHRIGNLVNYKYYNPNPNNTEWLFTAVEIVGINQSTFIFKHLNSKTKYKIGELHPIPLTEEWLLRFGFEKPAHSWNGDVFHLSEWDAFPLHWAVAMNKNGAMLVLKLKYVHQLQNLYFALTNQELEIK